jgi:arsenate reductase-like glutaredoxin family protein
MSYRKYLIGAVVATALLSTVNAANAGSIENLERERAMMMQALLSADLSAKDRQKKVALSRNRLIDLERMVMRDKKLVGRNTPAVRAAFESYDLTFLVHASMERERALLDHWLAQVGVSTQTLMNAEVGRR